MTSWRLVIARFATDRIIGSTSAGASCSMMSLMWPKYCTCTPVLRNMHTAVGKSSFAWNLPKFLFSGFASKHYFSKKLFMLKQFCQLVGDFLVPDNLATTLYACPQSLHSVLDLFHIDSHVCLHATVVFRCSFLFSSISFRYQANTYQDECPCQDCCLQCILCLKSNVVFAIALVKAAKK